MTAFIAGAVFAIGLSISGMTDPAKVIGFLDITGNWNPTLAFVMAGAVVTYVISYRLITQRAQPLFAPKFHLPTQKRVTPSLIAGSALFGIGWGIAGYCPGPALVSLGSLQPHIFLFVFSMMIGMFLHKRQAKI